jgi:hypothetical protein
LNYQYWREYLEWGVIENYKNCLDSLEYSDLAGVNFYNTPSPHFSGSFFWATSKYIKTLPDPSTKEWWYNLQKYTKSDWLRTADDRFRDEMWVCCNEKYPLVYVLHTLPTETNLAAVTLKRQDYVGKQSLFYHPV